MVNSHFFKEIVSLNLYTTKVIASLDIKHKKTEPFLALFQLSFYRKAEAGGFPNTDV